MSRCQARGTVTPEANALAGQLGEETNGDSRNIHQAIADGVNDQLRRFVDSQRIHDIGAMNGDGIGAEIQFIGDGFVEGRRRSVAELPVRGR